ncbi:MAG: RnfABCDGE type electron transport complex subunit D [Bauldia sp.]|nr:RnfABCDGE type electron transport complex subunit D [Bauldia sp.]
MNVNAPPERPDSAGLAGNGLRPTVQIRSGWTVDRVSLAFLAAVLPSLAVAIFADGGSGLVRLLGIALAFTLGWQVLFGFTRGSPVGWDSVVTAITMSLLLPLSASLWQLALATTVGVVLGELIFGGRGRSFLNPAVVGLAFFSFSFPAEMATASAALDPWPAFLGAVMLLLFRVISWRILLGGYAGLILASWVAGSLDADLILSAPVAFGMVFLAADPVCAASTNPSRWLYGLLIGVLAVLFGSGAVGVIFAILLASVFAPLLDQIAVRLMPHLRRRAPWLS